MKRAITLGIGALALAGMTLPTSAADLGARPITKGPVAAPVYAYNWTGCYIGANVGGKWGDFSGTETIGAFGVFGPSFITFDNFGNNNNDATFMGGGQLGCQWQSSNWVFGIEGDFDATDINRTFVAPGTILFPFLPGDQIQLRNDWQASVRGRLGYAWDRFLVYATGGVAFANVQVTAGFVPVAFGVPFLFAQDSQTLVGGTVGAGFEYGITENLSFGVEYRFTDFGSQDFNHGLLGIGLFTPAVTSNASLQTNEVTARLNWRFNWFGAAPTAARY